MELIALSVDGNPKVPVRNPQLHILACTWFQLLTRVGDPLTKGGASALYCPKYTKILGLFISPSVFCFLGSEPNVFIFFNAYSALEREFAKH